MSDAEPIAAREVTIARVFDAPASLLFATFSKAEHLIRWFGPKGWPLTLCEVDFRVGGRYRFAMTGDDGVQNTPFGGEYLEIVPDTKIVYDNAFEEIGAGRMIISVTFAETGGKTTVTVTTLFETVAMRDEYVGLGYEGGFNSGLDNLVVLLAELQGR